MMDALRVRDLRSFSWKAEAILLSSHAGDMLSFEEDAVRVEKPEVALPSDDMEAEKWKKDDDVQLLEPPKVDDAGQDVNPFSALNSQMSKVKISQTEATYPPAREGQETWRAFDISTTSTENDALDDTKQVSSLSQSFLEQALY
jgi:hypothetical protein